MPQAPLYAVLLVGDTAQAAHAALVETTLPIQILSALTEEDAQRLLRKHEGIVVVVLSEGQATSLGALLGTRVVAHGSMLDRVIALNYNPMMLVPGMGHVKKCVGSKESGFESLVRLITESIEYAQASE